MSRGQKYLVILNDPAYGTERSYNGMRLATSLAKRDGNAVRVFLLGDAVTFGLAGQDTPDGYYNLERMLRAADHRGVEVGACGTCLDARGLAEEDLTSPVERGSLQQLTDWVEWADKVMEF